MNPIPIDRAWFFRLALLAATALALGACPGAALGPNVRQEIAVQVTGKQPALSSCYKEALARDRTLAGQATLRFTVDMTGQFGAVGVNGIQDGKLKSCIENSLQGLSLGHPVVGAVQVTSPIALEPEPIP